MFAPSRKSSKLGGRRTGLPLDAAADLNDCQSTLRKRVSYARSIHEFWNCRQSSGYGRGLASLEAMASSLVCFGDSIAWGQGLDAGEKYLSLVAEDVRARFAGEAIETCMAAHSGASLGIGRVATGDLIEGEVPVGDPTEAEARRRNPCCIVGRVACSTIGANGRHTVPCQCRHHSRRFERVAGSADPAPGASYSGRPNGQSLIGALSTGTHGGDIELPPLVDVVVALQLVTVGGREIWVERESDGITEPRWFGFPVGAAAAGAARDLLLGA